MLSGGTQSRNSFKDFQQTVEFVGPDERSLTLQSVGGRLLTAASIAVAMKRILPSPAEDLPNGPSIASVPLVQWNCLNVVSLRSNGFRPTPFSLFSMILWPV